MNIPVIQIGNSKGIRLAKVILEKYQIEETVEAIFEKDCIIIKPSPLPRKGWDKAFQKMHANEDDKNLIADIFEDETFEEWS